MRRARPIPTHYHQQQRRSQSNALQVQTKNNTDRPQSAHQNTVEGSSNSLLNDSEDVFLAQNSIVKAQYYATLPLEASAIALERTYNVSTFSNVAQFADEFRSHLAKRNISASESQKLLVEDNKSASSSSEVSLLSPHNQPPAVRKDTLPGTPLSLIPLTTRLLSTRVVAREQWGNVLFIGPLPPMAIPDSSSPRVDGTDRRRELRKDPGNTSSTYSVQNTKEEMPIDASNPQDLFAWNDEEENAMAASIDGGQSLVDDIEHLFAGSGIPEGNIPQDVEMHHVLGNEKSGNRSTFSKDQKDDFTSNRKSESKSNKKSEDIVPHDTLNRQQNDSVFRAAAQQLFNRLISTSCHSATSTSSKHRSLQIPFQSCLEGVNHKVHSIVVGPNSLRYAATSGRSLLPLHTYADAKTDEVYSWGLGHEEALELMNDNAERLSQLQQQQQRRQQEETEAEERNTKGNKKTKGKKRKISVDECNTSPQNTLATSSTQSAGMVEIQTQSLNVSSSLPQSQYPLPAAVAVIDKLMRSVDIPRRGSSGAPNLINHYLDIEKAVMRSSTTTLTKSSANITASTETLHKNNSTTIDNAISATNEHQQSVLLLPRMSDLSIQHTSPAALAIFAYANAVQRSNTSSSIVANNSSSVEKLNNSGNLVDQTFRRWLLDYCDEESSEAVSTKERMISSPADSIPNNYIQMSHSQHQKLYQVESSALPIIKDLVPYITRSWQSGINFLGFFDACVQKGMNENYFRGACVKLLDKEEQIAKNEKQPNDDTKGFSEVTADRKLAYLRGAWPLLEELPLCGRRDRRLGRSLGPRYLSVRFPTSAKTDTSTNNLRRGALTNRLIFGISKASDLATQHLARIDGGVISDTTLMPDGNTMGGHVTVSTVYRASPPLDPIFFNTNFVDPLELVTVNNNAALANKSVCAATDTQHLWRAGSLSNPVAKADPPVFGPSSSSEHRKTVPPNPSGPPVASESLLLGNTKPHLLEGSSPHQQHQIQDSAVAISPSTPSPALQIKELLRTEIVPKVMEQCIAHGQHAVAIRLYESFFERAEAVPAQAALAYAVAAGGQRKGWYLAPYLLDLLATRVALPEEVSSPETVETSTALTQVNLERETSLQHSRKSFVPKYLGVILNTFVESDCWEDGLTFIKTVGLSQLTSEIESIIPLLKLLLLVPPSVMVAISSDPHKCIFGPVPKDSALATQPQHIICVESLMAVAEQQYMKVRMMEHGEDQKADTSSPTQGNLFKKAYGDEANALFSAFRMLYAPTISKPSWLPQSQNDTISTDFIASTPSVGCTTRFERFDSIMLLQDREERSASVINSLLLCLDSCARHGQWRKAVEIIDTYHSLLQPRVDVQKFVVPKSQSHGIKMTDTSSSNLRASLGQEDESELHLSNAVAAFLFESILKAERADLPLAALPELFLSVIRLVGFSFDIPLPYVRKVTGQSSSKGRPPTSDAFHCSMTLEEVFPPLAAVESSKAEGQQAALTSKVLSQGITRSAIPLYAKQQVEQRIDTLSGEWTVVGLIGDAEAYLKKVYHRREQLHSFFLNFATEHGFGSIAIEHGCKLVAAGRSVFYPDIRAFEPNKVLWRSYLREARRMYEAETLSISQQINDQVLADAFKNSRQRYAAHPEVSYAKFKERLRAAEQLYIKSQMPFLVFEDHSGRDHRDGGSTGALSLLVRPWQPILALTTPDAKNPATVPFIQHSTRGGNSFYGPLWAANGPSQGKQLVPLAGCFPVSPKSLAITNSIRTTRVPVPKLDEPAMQHYLKNYRHWAAVYQRRWKRIPFLDFESTTETIILPTRHSEATQLPVLCDAVSESAVLGAICPTPIRSETDSDALKKEHTDDFFNSMVVHTSPSSLRMQLVEGRDPLRLAGTIGIDQFAYATAKATSKAGEIAVVYRDPPSLSATAVDVQLTFSGHGASPAEAEVATAVFTREAKAAAHHMQQMVAKGSRRLRTHIAPSTVGASQLLCAMALQRFEFARVSVPKPEKYNVVLHNHPVPIGAYLAPRENTLWTAATAPPLPFAHLVPNFDMLALQEAERRMGGTLSASQDSRNRSGDKEVLSPSAGLSFGLPFHKLQSYRPLPSSIGGNGSTSSATSLPVSISLTADVPPDCVVLRKPYNVSTASLVRFYNLASQEVHFPNLRRLPTNHLQRNQQEGVNSAQTRTQMTSHTIRNLAEPEAPLSDCVTFKGMGVSYRPLLVLPPYATGLLPCVPLHYGRTFGAGSYVTVRARVMPLKGSANTEQTEGAAANRVAALFEDSDAHIMGAHSDSSSVKRDVLTVAFQEECSEVIKMFNIAVGAVGRSNDSELLDLQVEATVRLERGAGDGRTCLEHFEKSLLQCGWRVCGSHYHESNGSAAYQYIQGETDIKHNKVKSTNEIDKQSSPEGSKEGEALAITKVVFVCDSTMTTRSIQLSPAPVVGNVHSANVISTVEISDHE